MTPSHPTVAPGAPPPKKKTPVWVWILAAAGGAILLLFLAIGALGLFVANKALELAQNPRQLADMVEKMDANLEVLDVDDKKKTIRVRNKKDNSEVTISLEDLMNGKASISKKDKDGVATVELGDTLNLPNWVPKFPGVEPRSLGSAHSDKEGDGGVFTFTTNISPEKIRAFYKDGFEKRGLVLKADSEAAAALAMENVDEGLHATVSINESSGENRVTVAYGEKKHKP